MSKLQVKNLNLYLYNNITRNKNERLKCVDRNCNYVKNDMVLGHACKSLTKNGLTYCPAFTMFRVRQIPHTPRNALLRFNAGIRGGRGEGRPRKGKIRLNWLRAFIKKSKNNRKYYHKYVLRCRGWGAVMVYGSETTPKVWVKLNYTRNIVLAHASAYVNNITLENLLCAI